MEEDKTMPEGTEETTEATPAVEGETNEEGGEKPVVEGMGDEAMPTEETPTEETPAA